MAASLDCHLPRREPVAAAYTVMYLAFCSFIRGSFFSAPVLAQDWHDNANFRSHEGPLHNHVALVVTPCLGSGILKVHRVLVHPGGPVIAENVIKVPGSCCVSSLFSRSFGVDQALLLQLGFCVPNQFQYAAV